MNPCPCGHFRCYNRLDTVPRYIIVSDANLRGPCAKDLPLFGAGLEHSNPGTVQTGPLEPQKSALNGLAGEVSEQSAEILSLSLIGDESAR
jgi:hypothetical protein